MSRPSMRSRSESVSGSPSKSKSSREAAEDESRSQLRHRFRYRPRKRLETQRLGRRLWFPKDMANPEEIRSELDRAFDFRGDVTLTLVSGDSIEGYIFDRRSDGPGLEHCCVRLFPKDRDVKIAVKYSDIAKVEFTGRDMAAGRSFALWVQKYTEKRARGEKGISIEPEPLE